MYEFKSNLAVLIGINQYQNGIHPLKTAVPDAVRLAGIFQNIYEYTLINPFSNSETAIVDRDATLGNLRSLLTDILPHKINPTENDRLLFYFAGHGLAQNSETGPQGYIVPQDADLNEPKSLLPMQELHDSLAALECRHLLVILDCCFAGTFRWASTRRLIPMPQTIHWEHYHRFIRYRAWQVITSASYNQEALDLLNQDNRGVGASGQHSPFAEALFEALEQQKADLIKDRVITAPELYLYLRDYVEQRSQEMQTPGLWPLKKHDRGEFIFKLPDVEPNLESAPELNPDNNPYRGLKAYDEEHARFFFGRQELIQRLFTQVSRLQQQFTLVLGVSGSGKSSLVKAGLLPKLREEQVNLIEGCILSLEILKVLPYFPLTYLPICYAYQWQLLETMRPGATPFQELVRPFTPLVTNDLSVEEVKDNPQKLIELINQWSENNPKHKLLLVIDQFEELITQAPKVVSKEEDKRENWLVDKIKSILKFGKQKETISESEEAQPEWQQFIEFLVNILQKCPQLSIIVTLRSDFEPRFAESVLKPYWNRFIVRPMRPDELREVVEAPATEMALYFEPANLVDRLVDEVNQMPGALPLLSFTLSELYIKLYEEWKGGVKSDRSLTVDQEFEKQGGVAGSLTRRANQEYQNLPDDAHRFTMRRVMLRMVEIEGGEAVRRRVLKSELTYPSDKENKQVDTILKCLDTARLIVIGKDIESGESYYEPAHDFLVKGWNKLQDWIKKEQENLTLQQLLTPAAQAWEERGNNLGDLWTNNSRLELFKEIKQIPNTNWLNSIENTFVERSLQRKRNNVIFRWSGISSLLVISIVVGVILNGLRNSAEQRRIEAEKQTTLTLVSASETSFDSAQHLNALTTSIQAGKILQKEKDIQDDDDIYTQVILALNQAVYGAKEYNKIKGSKINFSPDNQIIATIDGINKSYGDTIDGNKLTLWNKKTNESFEREYQNAITKISFSSNNKVAIASDKIIEILSIDGKILKKIQNDNIIYDVQINADGNKIVAITNSEIKMWDLDGDDQIIKKLTNNSDNYVYLSEWSQLVLSPNSQSIAITEGENLIIWNLERQTTIKLNYGSEIKDLHFSKDAKNLTVVGTEWTNDALIIYLEILDINGKTIKKSNHSIPWEVCSMGPEGAIGSVKLSPSGDIFVDGKILAVSCWDGGIKLFEIVSSSTSYPYLDEEIWFNNFKNITSFNNGFSTPFFSPDGQIVAIAGVDQGENIIKLWRLQKFDQQKLLRLEDKQHPIVNMNWSPDQQYLATLNVDNTISIWTVEGERINNFPAYINSNQNRNTDFSPNSQSIDFSVDGKLILVGSDDGTINLWNFEGKKITSFQHGKIFHTVYFSPVGNLILSGSDDGKVNLWRLEGEKVTKIKSFSHGGMITDVTFSSDGKTIASANGDSIPTNSLLSQDNDNTIKLWSPTTGEELRTLTGHSNSISSIDFSPNGQMLVSGSFDGTLRLWDLKTGQGQVLKNDDDFVVDVSFSPQGQMIAIATANELESGYDLKLWSLDGKEIRSFPLATKTVNFNIDGQILASVDYINNSVLLLNFQLDDLLERGCQLLNDYLNNNNIRISEEERTLCS